MWMSSADIAAELNVSTDKALEIIKGVSGTVRIGRLYRCQREDFLRYIESKRIGRVIPRERPWPISTSLKWRSEQ